ncbi:ATP-dependent DNA helicase [Alkalilimnicola ehrlichii MLHE-1]|uniref:DNA 5'-3' helicase n=1 Tax=Alkalilimnicola ehrlichii (strain ATCC BAA-1101 / DSM 17681 / MLHE-1) TaxID=187272 RepID=Q0A9I2_ALKEH|nr:ATP-dependent DNA helicase [Alkalilimnicola ehrlichii]ABI56505.1 helicase c2 [Alkalilimnicola ehrlichii MLHE-1]
MTAGDAPLPEVALEVLGADGALAARILGFQPREAQQGMAAAVAEALADSATLVVEAGTGTGKTFAYLVPALLSGRRVVISTGTRTLQDQLFHRDLPLVRDALGVPLRAALLKGRGNYLCLQRLGAAREGTPGLSTAQQDALEQVAGWAATTDSGDLAEAPPAARRPDVRPRITATAENCLGGQCPRFSECHFYEARRRAQEADLVVINHHLLLADWALRESGWGEVVPEAEAWILDEAHQLPETAARFFGLGLSARQLRDLARDCLEDYGREAGDQPGFPERVAAVTAAADSLRDALGEGDQRAAWPQPPAAELRRAVTALKGALHDLALALAPLSERGLGLARCQQRAEALHQALCRFNEPGSGDGVPWFETQGSGFWLRLTPLDVSGPFRNRRAAAPAAWVFTSATLAMKGDFSHFADRLGLEAPRTLCLDSPFDYARRALLYLPDNLPDPDAPDYAERLVAMARPVITAAPGGAFLLFTSYRVLRRAAESLAGTLDRPLLVQGAAAQHELLARFRRAGDAVLLGTASFWEGVDVRGAALSTLIIDRLPFASPADPVLQARIQAAEAEGISAFRHLQLPHAVITLKQGVGRLIRDADDCGVLVIADPRLTRRGYGKVFLRSLPPMRRTGSLEEVQAFWQEGRDEVSG